GPPGVVGRRPVLACRLGIDLPWPAKTLEIVDEQPAHESLDRLVDIVDGYALFNRFVPVHLDELLRHARKECRAHAGYLGTLPGSRKECVQVAGKKLNVLASAVLQNERKSAGSANSGDRRRRKAESNSLRKLAQFPA